VFQPPADTDIESFVDVIGKHVQPLIERRPSQPMS
jgi:hypothetical protein